MSLHFICYLLNGRLWDFQIRIRLSEFSRAKAFLVIVNINVVGRALTKVVLFAA